MQPRGFEEEKANYAADDPRGLIGQIRRLGEAGPAYQIMGLGENGMVVIEIIETDERVASPQEEVLKDPMAETIS